MHWGTCVLARLAGDGRKKGNHKCPQVASADTALGPVNSCSVRRAGDGRAESLAGEQKVRGADSMKSRRLADCPTRQPQNVTIQLALWPVINA